MHHNIKKLIQPPSSSFKQRGAALIFMAFILGLGVAAYTIRTFNTASLQFRQDEKTLQTLGEAKTALIGWAVSHPNTPGQMPWPDRNGDGNYDGSSDCVTTAFQYSYLLGQLPIVGQTNPCVNPQTGVGGDWRDAQGNRLWYAVSRNLVRSYSPAVNPVINPGMINAPTYQWLRVLDRNGNLVSDRVAVVLIAPGAAIGGQNRSGVAPNASEFLDSFQIGAAVFNNRGYATDDEDFIMGDDSRNVSASDPTFVQPYHFNDKLVYITIDELMAALEKRVGEQARSSLKTYQDTNGYYPYAAQLGTTTNFACELTANGGTTGPTNGFLPVDNQSCTYTRTSPNTNLACTQLIFDVATSGVTQVRFDRTSGSPISNVMSGLCTRNNATRCTCTGAGTCGAPAARVTCTSNSCFSTGMMGSYRVTNGKFRQRSGGCAQTTFPTKTASCSNSNSVITCNTSNGTFSSCGDAEFGSLLPGWFEANLWQNYVFYQLTRPAGLTITVGNKTTEAAVATTGRPINSSPFSVKGSAQIQPSCNAINNYLDSAENTDGNAVFDSTSKQRASNYNDQTFIVAP